MTEKQKLTVDVVSDVVCPWCYVGLKRLDKAVAAVPELDVAIHWRPYQLDATVPAAGMDRKAYMLAKFGSEQRIDEIHARIEPIGAAEGIAFAFDAIKVRTEYARHAPPAALGLVRRPRRAARPQAPVMHSISRRASTSATMPCWQRLRAPPAWTAPWSRRCWPPTRIATPFGPKSKPPSAWG